MKKIAFMTILLATSVTAPAAGVDAPVLTLAQGFDADSDEVPANLPHAAPEVAARIDNLRTPVSLVPPTPREPASEGLVLNTGLERWLSDPRLPPPTRVYEEVTALRAAAAGEGIGALDELGRLFDMADDESPRSSTTSVRLLWRQLEVDGWVPFVSMAREQGALQDRERLGVGGGMAYYFVPGASLASELLYFGERGNSANAWERETRFTLRLQFEF